MSAVVYSLVLICLYLLQTLICICKLKKVYENFSCLSSFSFLSFSSKKKFQQSVFQIPDSKFQVPEAPGSKMNRDPGPVHQIKFSRRSPSHEFDFSLCHSNYLNRQITLNTPLIMDYYRYFPDN